MWFGMVATTIYHMNRVGIGVLTFVFVVIAVAGCGAGRTTVATSTADPGAPPSIPVTAQQIDSLLLPLDEINRLTGAGLTAVDPKKDRPADAAQSASEQPSAPCFVVDAGTGDVATYGRDWTAFRSVYSTAGRNSGIVQNIGVYPSDSAARAAFDRWVKSVTACKNSGAESGMQLAVSPDAVDYSHSYTYGDLATSGRIVGSVLITVDVSPDQAWSSPVADKIAAKLKSPV
ncbi:sensor domain-containing protein [Mycobacteroides saopaulense]|uniref:PknH-like extracellular domain-containing protein n=1 Tax=Mycobacteroides saopaulense TaxID=1578165 RepID=A0ABX3C629_9MYCO|nr:sensor domain-containing protein [Mycobacteroides saopaulense]OHT89064.1 hypothetical protein BKG68_04235 [Mycobacteroides saopaulense]OHU13885.1 hypothetical protein BKG73_04245 [Mycobacteroides saopaulense]